ncbi:hypothetical protein OKW39_006743 [Paraburkholderia sp. MM6662-R1]
MSLTVFCWRHRSPHVFRHSQRAARRHPVRARHLDHARSEQHDAARVGRQFRLSPHAAPSVRHQRRRGAVDVVGRHRPRRGVRAFPRAVYGARSRQRRLSAVSGVENRHVGRTEAQERRASPDALSRGDRVSVGQSEGVDDGADRRDDDSPEQQLRHERRRDGCGVLCDRLSVHLRVGRFRHRDARGAVEPEAAARLQHRDGAAAGRVAVSDRAEADRARAAELSTRAAASTTPPARPAR